MKVAILGAGLVGAPMALDLISDNEFDVTVADINPSALEKLKHKKIKTVEKDLSSSETVKEFVKDFDFVLSAVPGFMGFQTLKSVIEAGKNVVDIAFFPEDPFLLDSLAKEHKVTAIVDFGVAPGMSNVLIAYAEGILDEMHSVLILVGGLPKVREWPYEYKAVFSPVDVIEEYTRPARYIENGVMVTRPALTDPEFHDFSGIGTLQSFNSDGLRTLAYTIKCPNMKEKTLRYPGHIDIMAVLRETGFFSKKEIEVNGVKIRPLDFTAKLLFPKWKLKEGDEDITVMRVIVEGMKNGKKIICQYDLYDEYDRVSGIHSMARTTGFTATMGIRMLAKGMYSNKGVCPPEFIGRNKNCVEFIRNGLEARGIIYKERYH